MSVKVQEIKLNETLVGKFFLGYYRIICNGYFYIVTINMTTQEYKITDENIKQLNKLLNTK